MCVGEGGVYGEVSTYEEEHSWNGEVTASMEDVPEVEELAAVRACCVIRGGGAVMKGIVPLE
jgi:hypothetical protein